MLITTLSIFLVAAALGAAGAIFWTKKNDVKKASEIIQEANKEAESIRKEKMLQAK